jgi:hypothetical protein
MMIDPLIALISLFVIRSTRDICVAGLSLAFRQVIPISNFYFHIDLDWRRIHDHFA